ncbi:flagellar biosynthetic protein FliO [Telmatospirillum sp.]|uniref:FliO/MopB family protein n=1 Tax=Telmatospirillum sp. TaxID=2079197 RepID=UPI00283EDA6D|nr:flagellar biosynthetic protein FliO [Telmatospirillum sp.]MDR3438520.1 flagellar biosynthetic protein FliO [Telmatospirillum sp.]
MEWDIYLRSLLALVTVLAMIGVVAWLVRRFGVGGVMPLGRRSRRLAVVEVLPLDNRRRLVLVRKDDVEHLLLIGGASDIIVEKGWSVTASDEETSEQEKGKDQ